MQLGDKKRIYHQKIFVLNSKENLPNFPNWGQGVGGVKLPNSDGFFNEGQFVATNLLIGQV